MSQSPIAPRKLVILKFGTGSWNSGFPVTLQLNEETSLNQTLSLRPLVELVGHLPPMPELWTAYETWRSTYQDLGLLTRLERIENAARNVSTIELKQTCDRAAQHFRQQFNQWLKALTFAPIREKLLEQLTPQDTVRIILQIDNPQLQQLPWQLWDWLERYPNAEISLSAPQFQQISQQVNGPPSKLTKPIKSNKLKILAILGDRTGIDIDRDHQMLEQLPQAEITFLVEPQRQTLTEEIWAQNWDILFFAGHSNSRQGSGEIKLNATDRLTISELKFGLKKAVERGLQLALFNSCDGLGLARDLADLQIPQVMVMREPVPDRVAQIFLQYFLAAFSQGQSLYSSLRQAREKLQGLEQDFPCATWLPVLFQNPTAPPIDWPPPEISASKRDRPSAKISLLLGLLVMFSTLGLRHFQQLQPLELQAFDQLLRSRPDEPPDNRILVVTVTEADVQAQPKNRQGSLSDQAMLQLVQRLEKAQPRVIGLDIYRDYPAQLPALKKWMENSDNFVAICQVKDPSRSDATGVASPPEIAPENVGFSDSVLDYDQVQRRQLIAMTPTPGNCPAEYALNTQLALRYLAQENVNLSPTANGGLQLGKVQLPLVQAHWGGYQKIDDRGYQLLINYRTRRYAASAIEQVTLGEVLAGKIDSQFIRDRIVLIGTTAASFKDKALTPYRSNGTTTELPGVIIQAQMVSQLLSAALDKRVLLWASPIWGDWLWIGGWVTIGAILERSCRSSAWLGVATGSVVLLLFSVAWGGLVWFGWWVPLVPSALGLLGTVATIRCHERLVDRKFYHQFRS